MLQCHPCANAYSDESKSYVHCAFFMGLQRKQGVKTNEVNNMRTTEDEFVEEVMDKYQYRKQGMGIRLSLVSRKDLPSYVFPDKSAVSERFRCKCRRLNDCICIRN